MVAKTCSAGDFISTISAAGIATCTTPSGGGGGITTNRAFLTQSAPQTLTNGFAVNVMLFDTETYDDGNMHSTVTNTGRLTAPTAGAYVISCSVGTSAMATGGRVLAYIRVNGTILLPHVDAGAIPAVTTTPAVNISTTYKLAVNDYVECLFQHGDSGSVTSDAQTNFNMAQVSS